MDKINKRSVNVWLRYLIKTPLYVTYNVTVDVPHVRDATFGKAKLYPHTFLHNAK